MSEDMTRITYDRTRLKPGDLVMVSYPMGEKTNNPAHKYDGEQMVIKDVKFYPGYTGYQRKMFTLQGAESEAGTPYWFLPDELIPV